MNARRMGCVLCLAGGLSVVTACGGGAPRVDATSEETCRSSLEVVATSMATSADSAAFAGAMISILGKSMLSSFGASLASAFSGFGEDEPSVTTPTIDSLDVTAVMCVAMDGMTGGEVVAAADSITTEIGVRLEERVARRHLEMLVEAKAEFETVRDSLMGFEVVSSRLRQTEGFIGLEATIELHVRNSTNHPVSRAYFSAVAETPGRAVPWIQEEFNHSIPGGLEPGEEARWRLQPNAFQGDWTSVRVPSDAEFRVRVVKLDGADREALWGGPSFNEKDQILLDSLSSRFSTGGD